MGNLIALAGNTTFHISTSSLSLIMKQESFVESIQHYNRHYKKFYSNVILCNNLISGPIPHTIGQIEHLKKM